MCIPYPLRFLITSRPEAHIAEVFNPDRDLQAITVHKYNPSNDPDADSLKKNLWKYAEFTVLGGTYLIPGWIEKLTSLVERSCGHFIYASTVMRYIRSFKHRPGDRLEVILRLRPVRRLALRSTRCCYHQLDKICLVLGILYFKAKT